MLSFHYDQDLRAKYPSVAPVPAVLTIARINVFELSTTVSCTVELAIEVRGVLISYQLRLSSLP